METRCIHEPKEPKIAFIVIKSTCISTNHESKLKPAQTSKVAKDRQCIDKRRRSNALVWYSLKVVALHNS